jgi:hypothetical protein
LDIEKALTAQRTAGPSVKGIANDATRGDAEDQHRTDRRVSE